MLDFEVIKKIISDARNSMQSNSDGCKNYSLKKRIIFYSCIYIIPFFVGIISWIKEIKLSSIENYVGTCIAIFTGLFFTLLLNIGSKIKNERNNKDLDQANFQSFKTNMKQISDIILYSIMIGAFIFIIILLNTLFLSEKHPCIEKIFSSIALFLLTKFFVAIFFMIQRFYYVAKDEISNIL